jgi:hypothetical protein
MQDNQEIATSETKPVRYTKEEKQAREERFFHLTNQLQQSTYVQAYILTEIKSDKLYDCQFESFEDYVDKELPFLGIEKANDYVSIIKAFGESDKLKSLMAKKSLKPLIEAAKQINDQRANSPITDERIQEMVDIQTEKLRKKNQEQKEKLRLNEEFITTKENQVRELQQDLHSKQTEIDRIAESIAKANDFDLLKFKTLTSEKELKKKIWEMMGMINELTALICDAPVDLRTAEITGVVKMATAGFETSLRMIEDKWLTELADYTPHLSNRPQSIQVNSEDLSQDDDTSLVPN